MLRIVNYGCIFHVQHPAPLHIYIVINYTTHNQIMHISLESLTHSGLSQTPSL